MGTLKVKSKEEVIKYRKENSQWGYVWDTEKTKNRKRLIIKVFDNGECFAVIDGDESNYISGIAYIMNGWNNYELIEEPKPPVYKPWTKQPFESMFEAQEWEFKRKHTNSLQVLIAFDEDGIRFINNHFTNEKMIEQYEMRKRGGEWQPCGELVTE